MALEINNGRYPAKAKQWALAEAGTGTPEIAIEFAFSDPELAGKSITAHLFLSDKTFDRTIESLRHCGWTGEDLSDLTGLDTNEVEIVVENETNDDGETYPRVRWVNRVGGGLAVKAPMKPDQAKAFAAKMRGRIRALDAKANGPKTNGAPSGAANQNRRPSSPPPPAQGYEDDVPF